jgi:hypothetical protein
MAYRVVCLPSGLNVRLQCTIKISTIRPQSKLLVLINTLGIVVHAALHVVWLQAFRVSSSDKNLGWKRDK